MDGRFLYRQVVSTILEIKAKLGSMSGSCTLFYPFDGDLKRAREEFLECAGDGLTDVEMDCIDGRLQITVPESECIRISKMPVPGTLDYMISAVRDHKTIRIMKKELPELFDDVELTDMHNGEFELKVVFPDDVDPFIYCLHEECGQTIYHRFSKEDYSSFEFE